MTLNAKIEILWIFWLFFGCDTHFKSELHWNR